MDFYCCIVISKTVRGDDDEIFGESSESNEFTSTKNIKIKSEVPSSPG
mgnify:CR=1 FL=1